MRDQVREINYLRDIYALSAERPYELIPHLSWKFFDSFECKISCHVFSLRRESDGLLELLAFNLVSVLIYNQYY